MFDFDRGGEFGFCVSIADAKKAVIVLPKNTMDSVSLQVGGLTGDTFIYFDNSVLRPDFSSVMGAQTGSPRGALMCADGNYYMKAQEGAYYRTFNIQTGLAEDPKETANAFHFARWKVGVTIDRKFEPIFCFPAAA